MRRTVTLVILACLAWYGYSKYHAATRATVIESAPASRSAPVSRFEDASAAKPQTASAFKCDGRTRCSEMRSCDEATYFIKNCPNTKMDGDNDGIPCESQWCGVRR